MTYLYAVLFFCLGVLLASIITIIFDVYRAPMLDEDEFMNGKYKFRYDRDRKMIEEYEDDE